MLSLMANFCNYSYPKYNNRVVPFVRASVGCSISTLLFVGLCAVRTLKLSNETTTPRTEHDPHHLLMMQLLYYRSERLRMISTQCTSNPRMACAIDGEGCCTTPTRQHDELDHTDHASPGPHLSAFDVCRPAISGKSIISLR